MNSPCHKPVLLDQMRRLAWRGAAVSGLVLLGCSGEESTLGKGWTDCGSFSLEPHRLREDPTHCGACDRSCAQDDACNDGVCGADRNWALWPPPASPLSPANYTVTDTLATDNATHLTWQRGFSPTPLFWQEAKNYCYELALQGGGWRLPTHVEMLSIINYARVRPAIEIETFPDTPSEPFWVAHWPVFDAEGGWNLETGKDTALLAHTPTSDQFEAAWVRCVRSTPPTESLGEHYVVANETVLDTKTRLRWQQTSPPTEEIVEGDDGILYRQQVGYTQDLAEEYCSTFSIGPYQDGWRLPTITELQTLFRAAPDPTALYPVGLDPVAFPIDSDFFNQKRDYWSSTRFPLVPDIASGWVASLEPAPYISTRDPGYGLRVRCVRGPEL
jgi:hypothetical protein